MPVLQSDSVGLSGLLSNNGQPLCEKKYKRFAQAKLIPTESQKKFFTAILVGKTKA
jgi:hypothetical protein